MSAKALANARSSLATRALNLAKLACSYLSKVCHRRNELTLSLLATFASDQAHPTDRSTNNRLQTSAPKSSSHCMLNAGRSRRGGGEFSSFASVKGIYLLSWFAIRRMLFVVVVSDSASTTTSTPSDVVVVVVFGSKRVVKSCCHFGRLRGKFAIRFSPQA